MQFLNFSRHDGFFFVLSLGTIVKFIFSTTQMRVWLLSFPLSSPSVSLALLLAMGGLRLDEWCTTADKSHKYILLHLSTGARPAVMKRFGDAISSDVWTHPGFVLMMERLERRDPRLVGCARGMELGRPVSFCIRMLRAAKGGLVDLASRRNRNRGGLHPVTGRRRRGEEDAYRFRENDRRWSALGWV